MAVTSRWCWALFPLKNMSKAVQKQTVFTLEIIIQINYKEIYLFLTWAAALWRTICSKRTNKKFLLGWEVVLYFLQQKKKPQQACLPLPLESLSEQKGESCMQRSLSSMSGEKMLILKAWDYLAAQHQCSGFWEQQEKGRVYLVLPCVPKRRLRGSRIQYNRRYKSPQEILIY